MLRLRVKTAGASLLHRTGADQLVGLLAGSRRAPLVLGYHRVVEDFEASSRTSVPAMLVSRRMLERHLDWIGRRFRFVSLDELGMRRVVVPRNPSRANNSIATSRICSRRSGEDMRTGEATAM